MIPLYADQDVVPLVQLYEIAGKIDHGHRAKLKINLITGVYEEIRIIHAPSIWYPEYVGEEFSTSGIDPHAHGDLILCARGGQYAVLCHEITHVCEIDGTSGESIAWGIGSIQGIKINHITNVGLARKMLAE